MSLEEQLDGEKYWMTTSNVKKILSSEIDKNIDKFVIRTFEDMEETVEDTVSNKYFSRPLDISTDVLVNTVTSQTKKFLEKDFLGLIQKFQINIEETVKDRIDKMVQEGTLLNISGTISKNKNKF